MNRPGALVDSHGRVLRDLRVSITDRCNFRCLYCLPETEEASLFYRRRAGLPAPATAGGFKPVVWKPRRELLSFEEIERVVRVAVSLGITKIRVTGGEPLLRAGVEALVARLAAIPGIEDLAMTSNGFAFAAKAHALKQAGLRRMSFSMDSLDADNFKRMTGRDGLRQVLESIRLAQSLGFAPVKVNAVIIRGTNDHEVEALAQFACERSLSLRFIEFMPLDSGKAWSRELVVSAAEILKRLRARHDLLPVAPSNPSETARRWRFAGGGGEIGIIAPVTEPFCGHCNRLRLSADGQFRTCLFSSGEHDVKALLRNGGSDEALAARLRQIAGLKEDRHHIGEAEFVPPERTMSCIGG